MENRIVVEVTQSLWEKLFKKVTIFYIDTEDMFINKYFDKYKVRTEFKYKSDHRYLLRIIRISKDSLNEFNNVTIKVRNDALICGYTNFDEVFNSARKSLLE